MVPTTARTYLDHIGRQVGTALIKPHQFSGGGDAAPMGWQPGPEYVGDMGHLVFLADRTRLGGWCAALDGVAAQHRLGVTDKIRCKVPGTPGVDGGLSSQAVVDVCGPPGRDQPLSCLTQLTCLASCHQATVGQARAAVRKSRIRRRDERVRCGRPTRLTDV